MADQINGTFFKIIAALSAAFRSRFFTDSGNIAIINTRQSNKWNVNEE
jgi:hypothetical protein